MNARQEQHTRSVVITAFNPMTTTDRVAALYQLYLQLDELTTAEEMEAYPFLEHLADLIEDLEDDA